ncbi:PKD domain-containing protein [Rhodocytophaga rosea]|uniref:PKD domain-containing protein n=1 Tax=Rhodocytophaga rosea TaxID=2704465 RepID=A0A6C0GPJ3_9BACT|nr:PQQ-dependent sugar dehydrogenase [Rhodocytophaga rosea]QHT69502.1 PKD domain-containing protein [Rhodocytophaga rosea]
MKLLNTRVRLIMSLIASYCYVFLIHYQLYYSFSHRKKYRSVSLSIKSVCSLLIVSTLLLIGFENVAQTPPVGFSSATISNDWDEAVGLIFSKDGKYMFVWEKGGKVWVVRNGTKKLIVDISEEVGNWHDHGMLGFALHPNFDVNGYFYLSYAVDRHHLLYFGTSSYSPTTSLEFKTSIGRVTRYTATKNASGDYSVNKATRKILIGESRSTGIPLLSKTHGVGSLNFGTDGTLLVASGDGASPSATDNGGNAPGSYAVQARADGIITTQEDVGAFRSQLLESLNGKVLRINPETGDGIPSNPFYESARPRSARSRVFLLGLRNPFRVFVKPGTGSTDPTQGNPGVLMIGDVGFLQWEELNVATQKGQNFGWPLYEGLDLNAAYSGYPAYQAKDTFNFHAPNPLYGVNGCTQRYFKFSNLLKQESTTNPVFTNPCNTSQTIPASIKTFKHTRPIIDWKHSTTGPSRTGTFSAAGAATIANIGAAGSPVTGPQFGGNAAVAGIWYTRTDFPAEYRNTLFFGDYAKGWIRNITLDANNKPKSVRNFITSGASVVAMAMHPTEEGFYYINYGAEIKKITYGSTRPPVAVASVDKIYGKSPLTVQFTGSNSTDPEGLALTYKWDFGDGTSSTAANPSKTYTTSTTAPVRYNVKLTVTNSHGLSNTYSSLFVSVNNTPPVVTITSPANNTLYSVNTETTYNLRATVTDAEHSGTALSYQWQTVQHHEDHTHPGPLDTHPQTTSIVSPEGGCNGETFFFVITLKVTDAAGLSTTKFVTLYPDCNSVTANITNLAADAGNGTVRLSWTNPSSTFDEVMIVAKANSEINATPSGNGTAYTANLSFTGAGSSFDGGKVVYKGKVSPQTITNLTNNTIYHFKVFTRKSTYWSSGEEIIAVPKALVLEAVWNKVYGGGNLDVYNSAVPTSDGGYLLAGYSSSGVGGDKTEGTRGGDDYWVVKISSTGVKQWDKRFGGSGHENLNEAIQTSDGGYLLGGSTLSGVGGDKTEGTRGGRDYWVVKISSTGVKQWDKRFGGSGTDELISLIRTSDGGYLLGGYSNSGAGGDKSEAGRGLEDYWVVKISSTGVKQWDKRFGSPNKDVLSSLISTTDGGYLLAGTNLSASGGDKSEAGRGGLDYWVVKISSTGVKQWDKRFGGSSDDESYSLTKTADGAYIVGGKSKSGISGDKSQSNQGEYDYWIVKISSAGAKQWDKGFGGGFSDEFSKIIHTTDGGYLLGGNSNSVISGDKTEDTRGYADFWIVKLNSSGTKQWDKRFGGSYIETMHSLMQTSDGAIYWEAGQGQISVATKQKLVKATGITG